MAKAKFQQFANFILQHLYKYSCLLLEIYLNNPKQNELCLTLVEKQTTPHAQPVNRSSAC